MSDIDTLRTNIEKNTLDMVKLLKERTEYARQIGQIKLDAGKAVSDDQREASLRRSVQKLARGIGLDESAASRFLNFMFSESIKVQSPERRTHLSIFQKATELERAGKKIIHLEIGQPDFAPPPEAGDALGEAYDKGFVRYGAPAGRKDLREALAKKESARSNVTIKLDNILVCPGGRFGVFTAISTLLNPGDEIIIIEPAWPAYRDCAENMGIKVRIIPTSSNNGWQPDPEEIRKATNSGAKMLILNYPNNPTGAILDPKVQDELVSIAKSANMYILSDEIYSDYAYKEWCSITSYQYEKSIAIQSFSKSHAMTGFRIGYAISNPDIISKMSRLQALCMTSVAEPIQHAALRALDADISENARIIRRRLDYLEERAKSLNLEFARPKGAMYLFVKPPKGPNCAILANSLLENGLAVVPGSVFGEYGDHIRISACQDEGLLARGMDILGAALEVG